MKLKNSGLYSLKTLDFLKGAIMAIATPVLYVLQELIPGYDLSPILKVALSAFVAYLIKNFFTDKPKPTTLYAEGDGTVQPGKGP